MQGRAKEPLGTDSHRTISELFFGHKKCFVLLCPISEQFLLSSFCEFVHDSYCLDQGLTSSGSCTKEMQAVRRLTDQFDIKSPSDFKILSARKLKTLFQKYKLELTLQVFTLASVKFCINIREFLKDTTMAESHENVVWKSEFTFFQ